MRCPDASKGMPGAEVVSMLFFFPRENVHVDPRRKTLILRHRTRDGQAMNARPNRRRILVRVGDFMRECRSRAGAASPRYDDSSRPASARVPIRARAAQNVRGHGRRRNAVTTRERRDLARAAMRLLSGTDGNSVQRTAPTVVSLPLATTSTGMPAPVTAARQEETTSRGDRARAATCVSRKPGSDTEGQAR